MAIANGLLTLGEARASLGWPAGTQTSDDSDLERYIEAVTPVIENITGPLLPRTITHTASGGKTGVMLPDEFASVVSVTVDGVPHTGWVASPAAGIVYADGQGGRFPAGRGNVVVVATVGAAAIPANVNLAARELVRHLWQVGRQGGRPGFGVETADASAIVPTGFAVPNRVMELLQPNARSGGFA